MTDNTDNKPRLQQAARESLKGLIESLGLTPTAFEREIGYTGNYVQKILSGARPVRFDLVGRIFKRYGFRAGEVARHLRLK